eukprot:gene2884-10664_t
MTQFTFEQTIVLCGCDADHPGIRQASHSGQPEGKLHARSDASPLIGSNLAEDAALILKARRHEAHESAPFAAVDYAAAAIAAAAVLPARPPSLAAE